MTSTAEGVPLDLARLTGAVALLVQGLAPTGAPARD